MLDPTTAVHKIVAAGLQVLYSPQTRKMLAAGLAKQGASWQIAATEVAGVLKLLDGKSNGTMPKDAMAQAGKILLLDYLKFMQEVGKTKVSSEEVKKAVGALRSILLKEYATTPPTPAPSNGAPPGMIVGGQ